MTPLQTKGFCQTHPFPEAESSKSGRIVLERGLFSGRQAGDFHLPTGPVKRFGILGLDSRRTFLLKSDQQRLKGWIKNTVRVGIYKIRKYVLVFEKVLHIGIC
jgi:hypothetical protein